LDLLEETCLTAVIKMRLTNAELPVIIMLGLII
jgi:hypothetical protein